MQSLKTKAPHFIRSILNSYSQIFFSNSALFAVILILVTFFDLYAGISGLLAVLFSNITAYIIGFNRHNIKSGFYGFNSLLVGLGLGVFYNPNIEFFVLLFFASILTLFITLFFEGVIGKYGLPFLSVPFLFGIWMVILASREFQTLIISDRGIFLINELYGYGGLTLVKIYEWFGNLNLHDSITSYFKSLGAIFFQYHLLAGILVAVGLLLYSRIAFLLSLTGFFSAYFYYMFIGANIHELDYAYIGFNFILTAIAVGGLFVIPSGYSFLYVVLLTPLISFAITSTNALFSLFQLSVYSLPFNFIVLLFLYVLKFRERFFTKPEMVSVQHFSPEKNLYSHLNHKERFSDAGYLPVNLPFWGMWQITQGHNGEFTHKDQWRHAWDFEIFDEEQKPYTNSGSHRENFYCYGKPVIVPADGWIEEVVDHIEDNKVGEVNLEDNWGNTIVIRHSPSLFSKLSHLKTNSVKVKKGDFVKKGDVIAHCGNSGRSPKPHLHFQLQTTPYIGSQTLDYPLSNYIISKDTGFELKSYATPEKEDFVSNIEKDTSLYNSFHFIPGQKLKYKVQDEAGKTFDTEWEVVADIYNNTFLLCHQSKAKAFFINDGNIHYFTHFEGSRKTLLYYFYLGAYKVINGFYKELFYRDKYPLNVSSARLLAPIQDLFAPFWIFTKPEFSIEYIKKSDTFSNNHLFLQSTACVKIAGIIVKRVDFEIKIINNKVSEFRVINRNRKLTATWSGE